MGIPEKIEIVHLIGFCQVLELGIKVYIGWSYNLIQQRVGNDLVFNYSYDDVKDMSLERLLIIFKKLNSNDVLITRLGKLKDYRNLLAHKALLLVSDSLDDSTKATFLGHAQSPIDFNSLKNELEECISLLRDEALKLSKT